MKRRRARSFADNGERSLIQESTLSSVTTQPVESRASATIREIFESGRPLTYIRSSEEQRIGRLLREVSRRLEFQPVPVWEWSLTEGLHLGNAAAEAGTESPRVALDFIAAHREPAIFHLKDFHEPLRDSPEIRRRLRDIYESCLDQRKFVVITSPVRFIPEEVERNVIYVELRPPDLVELVEFLREESERLTPGSQPDDALLHQLGRALQGLTLETLKKWLLERRKLFQLRDSLTSEIVPKGLLLMGIPGCGKSLSVKAIASSFQLPLYRIDMIEIFSGRHGKPEGVFVEACRMMEDMAPAVLWFDEIEMGITSTDSGGEQGRIFAFFLTWMQEKARGLFVAATANRIDLLPAEMIRKGRFDEVFFVDLPLDDERVEIFKIHLNRRGVDASRFQLDQLKKFTTGWAGAEIEQCVVAALTQARLADREVSEQDLINVAVKTVPLSRTMKEQINHIRSWAFERALRASPQPL